MNETAQQVAPAAPTPARTSLVTKFAERFGIEPSRMLDTLKATCFKTQQAISNEQMAALLIVADQYNLNPFTKEIYAYPDKNSGIVPVVGVDGWSRIINSHPDLDGITFVYSEETKEHKKKTVHDWIECHIYRKDRSHPTVIREYFDEVVRIVTFVTPWDSHPKRMHRHKALIQCARVAFGFSGIYDEDEYERVKDAREAAPAAQNAQTTATLDALNGNGPAATQIIDAGDTIADDNESLPQEDSCITCQGTGVLETDDSKGPCPACAQRADASQSENNQE